MVASPILTRLILSMQARPALALAAPCVYAPVFVPLFVPLSSSLSAAQCVGAIFILDFSPGTVRAPNKERPPKNGQRMRGELMRYSLPNTNRTMTTSSMNPRMPLGP